MLTMIIKMSLITLLYVGVTFLLWKNIKGRKLTVDENVAAGLLFGILAIFSTHFGVDYGDMMLNVRDLGPMTAGLFFSPVSGIIAGLVGGIERYVAGYYFGVGEYTTAACSISTILAGFLSAFLNRFLFRGKRPAVAYSFFLGAVIEVFHMYVVFITHRDDVFKAFYVVRVCSLPMILFSAVGLALIAFVIKVHEGEWNNPLKGIQWEKVSVSSKFQMWLFGVTAIVLILNFSLAFAVQSETAIQEAKGDMEVLAQDIGNSVEWIYEHGGNTENYTHSVWSSGSFAVTTADGELVAGTQYDKYYNPELRKLIMSHKSGDFFTTNLYGDKSLCYLRETDSGLRVFVQLYIDDVYEERDIYAYEILLADILLFTAIYLLVSLLVQGLVVNKLQLVNESLNKITGGDLNEKVEVYSSQEFVSLSNDINQTVDTLKGYIDAAEKRMEQELLLAHTIQDAALPKNYVFTHKGFELYATMDPAKEVGGDFYDFFFVGPDKLALVIADVSGKGIPAALFMMRSKTAIRSLAETGSDLCEIFEKVNAELCQGNDINMFVTVWMGMMDLKTGSMRCINAGHEYPVIKRSSGDFEIFKEKHSPPLGVMEDVEFHEYELQLEPGDCIYVYTDGVPDAVNTAEEQYGTERMTEILNKNKDAGMEALLHAVKEDIDVHVGEADQFDDITMIGFRYEGSREGW